MSERGQPARRTPLAHRSAIAADGRALRLEERPFVGKHILRANRHEAVEPLRVALGLGLPFDALTSSTVGDAAFLWLGPDEWMVVGDSRVVGLAADALAGSHHQLVDVGDYYTVIELTGAKARDCLMKLTTLDLHPRAFGTGMVSGGVFGRANAILWLRPDAEADGSPLFWLFIRWSMADYLWCLLANAGREWGVPDQAPLKGETLTIA